MRRPRERVPGEDDDAPTASQVLTAPRAAIVVWNTKQPDQIPTGLAQLDESIGGGLSCEGVSLLVGGTGAGKTGMAIQIARHCATVLERPVLYVTSELSRRQMLARFSAQAQGRPWKQIFEAGPEMAGEVASSLPSRLYVIDAPPTSADLELRFAEVAALHSLPPFMIVDYLQHVARRDVAAGLEYRVAVAGICDRLSTLARRAGASVLALSSCGRGALAKRREGRERRPSDWIDAAKESGDLEYDAALLLGLELSEDGRSAQLQVAKNRFGNANGSIDLTFDGAVGKFSFDGDRGPREIVDRVLLDKRRTAAKILDYLRTRPTPANLAEIKAGTGTTNGTKMNAGIDYSLDQGFVVVKEEIRTNAAGQRRSTSVFAMTELGRAWRNS